jgi:methylenetetrahydrofolate reductase (NADPH)
VAENDVNAVTWGVFRGREVIQPTVVDHQAFMIWKNEALQAFVETWARIYQSSKGKDGTVIEADEESILFLKECRDTFYLVNIVDNNYVDGDLSGIVGKFIEEN